MPGLPDIDPIGRTHWLIGTKTYGWERTPFDRAGPVWYTGSVPDERDSFPPLKGPLVLLLREGRRREPAALFCCELTSFDTFLSL